MDEQRHAMMSTVSLRLIDVLNHIGLSEEVRCKRRRLAREFENIKTIQEHAFNNNVYVFGSQSEGSTTPGLSSDIDILYCNNDMNIIQTIEGWTPGRVNCLMFQDIRTRPGYVKLWVCDENTPRTSVGYYGDEFVYDEYDRCLLPRQSSTWYKLSRNGPAETLEQTDAFSADIVNAYRCHSWPKQAQGWLQRTRSYNWPSQEIISHIKNNGCFLVPVGHSFSAEKELEWKISFSLSERELIWSLNEVQFKCYVLMKITVKTFFKPYMEDGICSYHCKMCILHATENTDESLWRPENLLLCLSQCLYYFRTWLEAGNLPHYFMPEHNLFEHKVHGEIRTQAYSILQGLISEDFSFLQRIECDNIGQLLCTSCSSAVVQMLRFTVSESTYKSIGQMAVRTVANAHPFMLEQQNSTLSVQTNNIRPHVLCSSIAHLHHLSSSHDDVIRTASRCLLPLQLANLAFYILSNFTSLTNIRDRVRVRNLALNAIKHKSVSPLLTTKLKVAGICCMYGDINVTLNLLDDIIACEGNCLIKKCLCTGIFNYVDWISIGHRVLDCGCSLEELVNTLTSACVMYSPEEIRITPKALQYEMFRSIGDEKPKYWSISFWYGSAMIDPPIYMYFLQYLCFKQFNKSTEKRRAIRNIIARIRSKKNLGHIETALNVLGHCLLVENELNSAYKCFRYSMLYRAEVNIISEQIQRSPHHYNAAKWHLAVTLNNLFKTK